jgi:hypothetical protein
MSNRQEVHARLRARAMVLFFSFTVAGCGGSGYTAPGTSPPPIGSPAPSSITGNWEIIFHSQDSPDHYFALEANSTQTATQLFAGKPSALFFQAKSSNRNLNGIAWAANAIAAPRVM